MGESGTTKPWPSCGCTRRPFTSSRLDREDWGRRAASSGCFWRGASRSDLRLGRRYRPPGNSSMALRFLSLESILNSERSSVFFRSSPCAISLVDAGELLTCRKRNMLSGLRCEGRAMGCRARPQAPDFHYDFSHFFWFSQELFLGIGDYIRQANTRPAGRPPSDWPDSRRGKRREAGRPGPPPFSFSFPTYPFTQTTWRKVWTISTRSLCAAITASIGL